MTTCLHVIKNAQPECTGIARLVSYLAKYSGPFGYDVSVLFLGDGPLVEAARNSGIRANAISWTASRSDPVGAWGFWRWMRTHPAEVVQLHNGGVLLRTLCRMAGARAIVQHLHGRVLEPSGVSISQLSFRAADAVVACSNAVADCFSESRPEVIYSGIETASEPPPASDNKGPLTVGVLARLIPLKNVAALIEATAILARHGIEIRAEIAGTGPLELSLREIATSLGIKERVRFLGWQADIQSLLKRWDVLAIPSLEEGFPISALEGMAAARPVVASRIGGLGELVDDGITGMLFDAGDTDALVRSLAELASNREKSALMGREGWKRVREHFSAELMARRTAELYDRLLNRDTHRAAKQELPAKTANLA
jgi:glycosyltransferase involved in cell wall biosynthesis